MDAGIGRPSYGVQPSVAPSMSGSPVVITRSHLLAAALNTAATSPLRESTPINVMSKGSLAPGAIVMFNFLMTLRSTPSMTSPSVTLRVSLCVVLTPSMALRVTLRLPLP